MIDTLKIITMINKEIYSLIKNKSIIKTSYSNDTGEVFYTIVNNSLKGSYDSSLSIRVGEGSKYKFKNMYYIEIEGSYHKLIRGYNSHNGFYNLCVISQELINMVEKAYNVNLPSLKHWFLQRVDIAICYDLSTQDNVITYINNLNCCNFPRRKLKHFEEESIYLTGSTTTLKIYNKLREFKKHDLKKLKQANFNIYDYQNEIQGFIRFECEIKKRKLKQVFKKDYIRINSIYYNELKNIWFEEFNKFFKQIIDNSLPRIYEKEEVKHRLLSLFNNVRAMNLFKFYLIVKMLGLQEVKRTTNKSMYYKNISDLKKANIDFCQKMDIDLKNFDINFNPFKSEEIL